jgi:antitoxin (DNA-binding transcriptional repressor) of toxin-antitoxin stability system
MATTTSIRELRNQFPKVRRILEQQGEVLLTERGRARYRLTLYAPTNRQKVPPVKDYLERLMRHQPRPLSAADAKALNEENRGER